MTTQLDVIDQKLLDDFQRDLPLYPRPFAVLAEQLGITESEVLTRLAVHQKTGRITRVGATVRPNTVGASTLAALKVPRDRIEATAARVGSEPGVNHSYLREHDWNLWFVATAPDSTHLANRLAAIQHDTGLEVLDLRLARAFNIDLGFSLNGTRKTPRTRQNINPGALQNGDRALLQGLSNGLPLTPRPWADLARTLGRAESAVLSRTEALLAAGIISRLGVIVRHRAVGWTSNAMVVWDVPAQWMETAGRMLAAHPGVTLCYERHTVPGKWRFGLFSMIHARGQPEALSILASATRLSALHGVDHEVLFSTRCFKQTGAQIALTSGKAA